MLSEDIVSRDKRIGSDVVMRRCDVLDIDSSGLTRLKFDTETKVGNRIFLHVEASYLRLASDREERPLSDQDLQVVADLDP